MSARIVVTRVKPDDPAAFDVLVREGASETRRRVTLSEADLIRLAKNRDAETLIEAAFRFLLDHEPKEAILRCFDVSVIARYFPQFEKTLPSYLDGE